MIIRKLRMVNFRGFCNKTIDFDDKPVVLISAANGIGKTTTIDAIEWCLTGEIGRLEKLALTKNTILQDVEVVITYDSGSSFQWLLFIGKSISSIYAKSTTRFTRKNYQRLHLMYAGIPFVPTWRNRE